MTTVTAREFNRDVSAAKRAADLEPVIVTDRGKPAYVLMAIDEYRRLTPSTNMNLAESLRMESDVDVEFHPLNLETQAPEW